MSAMRAEARALWALLHWSLWTTRKQPFLVMGEIVRPMIWLAFMSLGMTVLGSANHLQRPAHQFLFAGVLILTLLQAGLRRPAFLLEDRRLGFVRALTLAPSSRFTLVVAIVLSNALVVVLQSLVFTLIAVAFLRLPLGCLAPLAAAIALLAVGTVAAGLWLASLPWRPAAFRTVVGIVTLPAYFLSGGVVALEKAPRWLLPVIRANPLTYGVDLARHAMAAPTHFALVADLVSASVFAAAMIGLAGVFFQRRLIDLRPQRMQPRPRGQLERARPSESISERRAAAPSEIAA